MRRYEWTTRSGLWFVFLVALALKVATGTLSNLKRGSVEYHRRLSEGCDRLSASNWRHAANWEDEASALSIKDPPRAAGLRWCATSSAADARLDALLAASLAKKAELCEQSLVGWIFLQYDTSRNPPDLPVRHVSGPGFGRPWPGSAMLAPLLKMLAPVDFLGLACLALAIIARRKFAHAPAERILRSKQGER